MIDSINEIYGKHVVGDYTHTFYSGVNDNGNTEWCVYTYRGPNEDEIVAVCWYSEAEYREPSHLVGETIHAVADPYGEALAYFVSIGGSV